MMKKLAPVSVITLLLPVIITAQTWVGLQDNNWGNPANWSSGAVLTVVHRTGTNWKDEGNGGTTGSMFAGTVQSANGIGSFSPFTLASATASNALPVVYFSFTVRLQPGGTVLLNWQADEMTEHEYFEIQRSTDGSSWQTIGIVQPNITNLYSFVDRQPLPSINYYRLKNVDNTGFCTFSPVKVVVLRTGAAVAMWPNPVTDELHLQVPSAPATVRLVDAAGNVVRSARLNQPITIISFKGLQPGLYVLQVQSAGKIYSGSVIKY